MAHKLEDKPRTSDVLIKEDYTFNSLFLPDKILQGLKDCGFYRPSPIQLKSIPLGRCGLDLIVQAKSGTGKTLVFALLALENVNIASPSPQVVILAPTREIAVQIEGVIKSLASGLEELNVACFIGGLPIEDDIKNLKGCHIAIGAPGRMKSLIEKRLMKTTAIRLLVLDEADILMEHSFQDDINFIYNNLPQRKQVLAFSATYPDQLDKFLANYMHSPTFVTPEIDRPLLLGLQQFVSVIKEHLNVMQQLEIKTNELIRLLTNISFTQCLVFFNFQTRAETISHLLKQHGLNASYITGSQPQTQRLKVINSLKKFECRILLTTDLTARGIDASNVNLVINYEVPFKAATYLHRMGRAGRYGSHGICITIASDGRELQELQKILGQIGGSELKVPKIPDKLDDIWTCNINELEKVDSIVGSIDDVSLKQTVRDLKTVANYLENLHFDDKNENATKRIKPSTSPQKPETDTVEPNDNESIVLENPENDAEAEITNEEFVSAHDLYPWVPVEKSVLSEATGEDLLLEDFNTADGVKKRKLCNDLDVSNEAKLTLSKNIALYNSAKLLTSNDLHLTEHLSESVGEYFNVLEETNKKREKEMEKFFESYSCDDILQNLAQHTEAWSKAECVIKDSPKETPEISKENIFRASYDFMTKGHKHWTDFLTDYSSAEDENEIESAEEDYFPDDNTADEVEEEEQEQDHMELAGTAMKSQVQYNWDVPQGYLDVSGFKEFYDQCSRELEQNIGTFDDAVSANDWYDCWRLKLAAVTDYVHQNLATYEMGQYQCKLMYYKKK